jgi:hypothetical protein
MDFEHRAIVQEFWQSPYIPTEAGLKAIDLFASAAKGEILQISTGHFPRTCRLIWL